jgi:hypothetical protein
VIWTWLFRAWALGAFAYAGLCAVEIAMSPVRDKMVDALLKVWNESGRRWYGQPFACIVMLFYASIWPILVVLRFIPSVNKAVAQNFRRQILDRDGLLKPQMPAQRCMNHNVAYDKKRITCSKCKNVSEFDHCDICCRDYMGGNCGLEATTDFSCVLCRPIPKPACPWHGYKELTARKERCSVCRKKIELWGCNDCITEGRTPKPKTYMCWDCMVKTGKMPVIQAEFEDADTP